MKKRLVNSVIASTLLGVALLNVNPVAADNFDTEIQQAQQEAQENTQAAESMNALINQLTNEVANTQEALNTLNGEIERNEIAIAMAYENLEKATNELNTLLEEIAVLEDNIAVRSDKLKLQARTVQVNGNPNTYLEFILNSESITDVIGRLEVVSSLVKSSNSMMEEQIRDQKAVEEKSKETELKVAQQNALAEQLVNTSANLDAQKVTQIALVSQLELERSTVSDDREALLAKRNDALQRVADIENERESVRIATEKAAQERAAREEQEKIALESAQVAKVNEPTQVAKVEVYQPVVSPATSTEKPATNNNNQNNNSNAGVQTPAPAPKPAPAPAPKPAPAPTPKPTPAPVVPTSGWSRPTTGGYVSSRFGPRWGTMHRGIDLADRSNGGNGPIYILAAKSGTVTTAGWHYSYGNYVVINHGNGLSTLYAHMLSNLTVSAGQSVSAGQQIGTMGSTGDSTGYHLHFEIMEYGNRVNPENYMSF